jgi:hypothetical protein
LYISSFEITEIEFLEILNTLNSSSIFFYSSVLLSCSILYPNLIHVNILSSNQIISFFSTQKYDKFIRFVFL